MSESFRETRSLRDTRVRTIGARFVPWLSAVLLSATALLAGAGLPTAAIAQEEAAAGGYEELDVYPKMVGDSREAKSMRSNVLREVRSILRGSTPLVQKQRLFDAWYNVYYFPLMTQVANVSQLHEMRRELFEDGIQDARSDEAHDHLVVNLTFPMMKRIVEGNFHPAVRYNAMLVIASLNAREARTVGDRTPPEPLPLALTYLLSAAQQPDQNDALLVAALYGLRRHVDLDRKFPQYQPIPANLKQQILGLMESIASAKEPPAGTERSPEGHAWVRRMAIETIAAAGAVGDNNKYVALLDQTVADRDAAPSLRCTAAHSLRRLNLQGATRLDPMALAANLGNLAADACRAELDRMDEEQARREAQKITGSAGGSPGTAPGGFGSGMPGMDGPPGMPGADSGGMPGFGGMGDAGGGGLFGGSDALSAEEERSLLRTRRRLKFQFFCVQEGLGSEESQTGIGTLVADPQKEEFKKIRVALADLMRATDEDELNQEELGKALRNKVRVLEALVVREEDIQVPAGAPPAGDVPGADLPGGAAPGGGVPGGNAPKAAGGAAGQARGGADLPG